MGRSVSPISSEVASQQRLVKNISVIKIKGKSLKLSPNLLECFVNKQFNSYSLHTLLHLT